jgi:type VI secretion system protein ImpA
MADDDSGSAERTIVDTWLEPLGDPVCGEDLEYDNEFLELTQAAAGKPETQFAPAEAPDWRTVGKLSESLLDRTRDLRIGILWARSKVCLEGAETLTDSLRLVHGLLERYWDDLHPKPDDGDAYARVNALADMCTQAGLLGDLRQSALFDDRAVGALRGREIEIALGSLEAREDESPPSRGQIQQMLAAAVERSPAFGRMPAAVLRSLESINELMRERVGYGSSPDLQPLIDFISGLQGLMPAEGGDTGDSSYDDTSGSAAGGDAPAAAVRRRAASGGGGGGLGSSIESREDALKAIDMVCNYLERAEPTNPAQLLLRRARKLVNKNFMELVREFAPESLEQVARVMGVSVEEISSEMSDE